MKLAQQQDRSDKTEAVVAPNVTPSNRVGRSKSAATSMPPPWRIGGGNLVDTPAFLLDSPNQVFRRHGKQQHFPADEPTRPASPSSTSSSSSQEPVYLLEKAKTWPTSPSSNKNEELPHSRSESFSKHLPERRKSVKPRNRFSLPTIQELKTYDRDLEFAKLDERPKRGLNLPRSKSVKPAAMSLLLQEEDDASSSTSEALESPVSAPPDLMSTLRPDSSEFPPSPSSETAPRTANGPSTPQANGLRTRFSKPKYGFFKSD